MSDVTQEWIDTFYWSHGPCCAGCDRWKWIGSQSGECTASAPMSGAQRLAMLGITWTTLPVGAGHALTRHDHHCGEFVDDFDWWSLPLAYRARIGAPRTVSSPSLQRAGESSEVAR